MGCYRVNILVELIGNKKYIYYENHKFFRNFQPISQGSFLLYFEVRISLYPDVGAVFFFLFNMASVARFGGWIRKGSVEHI